MWAGSREEEGEEERGKGAEQRGVEGREGNSNSEGTRVFKEWKRNTS